MTKKFVFRSSKYNITHQDTQKGIEDRGYIDANPTYDSETNPLSKWRKYQGERNDTNLFVSSSNNLSRIQIHDAINRLYDDLNSGQINIVADINPTYHSGYNFNKQKLFNYVEEYLLKNPSETLSFAKDPQQFLVSLPGLNIKNILIYNGANNTTNTTFSLLKTNTGEKIGHHKDGKFEKGLQGPFTEAKVGGYNHRHQPVGSTTDRPERFNINDDGTTISFTSPIKTNSQVPYSRFSRDGFTKSAVNIKNIKIFGSNSLGNFSKNYEIVNGLHRKNQNLALVDQPNNFTRTAIDSPVVSGTSDYSQPNRKLLDGTYNKSVYVNKFSSPGDIRSVSPVFMDPDSEEYSAYNTLNYRNLINRIYLKNNLATASYFGGYISGAFGTTASYQKTQRNNRYVPVSGATNFVLRSNNAFHSYGIPARDGGYSWINAYTTGGNNPGLYVNGVDNDIVFITASKENYSFALIDGVFYKTYTTSSVILDASVDNVLRYYNIQLNQMWNYTPKKQLSQNYNPIIIKNKKQNYYADYVVDPSTNQKADIRFKDSFIKDKHTNIISVYVDENGVEEKLSYPFGQKYESLTSNFYRSETNQIINIYKDFRNITKTDKSNSLFSRLYKFDKYVKENNLNIKKIKKIIIQEKIYPRSQNVYRNFARARNAYLQNWSDSLDNRLTEFTNSQGKVFASNTSGEINNYSSTKYKHSYWPMDAYSTKNPSEIPGYTGLRDKSGELMQLDNVNYYSTLLGYSSTNIVVPSGSYFGARFGRNWNTNRPANVVHEQAGRGPFLDSYEKFYSDIKLIGQGCSVIPEYRISPRLDEYYSANISYYDNIFNSLELTGTVIEDYSLAISTSSAFLEQRVNSDYIDLNEFINKEVKDFKLDTIKLKVKGIKKFLPYHGLYPQQRMLQLATQFSSSYKQFFITMGSNPTFRTALAPFYSPGIGFNSIKSGVGMPYCIASVSSSDAPTKITSSIDVAASYYYKLPWDSILYPQKRLREISSNLIIYDIDPDITVNSLSALYTITVGNQINFNYGYDYMANNFYSEVVNFFKNTSKLTSLQSRPGNQWYFPDLTKKYAMDIVISKEGNFYTYSSFENFGPKPYAFHAPPWHNLNAGSATTTGYNTDASNAPNSVAVAGSSYATIVFDPGSLAVGDLSYFVKGQFNIGDILRNSTVSYHSTILSNNTSSATIQVGDIVDLFSVSADGLTWQPKLKWECPTANLNFSGLSAKLTNSSGNDSGDNVVGNAIRGIWHQYAPVSNNNDGLFLSIRNSNVDTTLTGSLADIVGFDKSERGKIGEISSSRKITEALIIIPYYLDDCGTEKYFDIDIELFERLYANNSGIVGEIKIISRNYILPPQIDFIKFRDQATKGLEKEEYKIVKSPFIMFPFEFSSTLDQQDLADIWQGVLPVTANTAEIDYQEKEFFIGNYLKELNFRLPDNTRFKVFKVKKRAIINYEEINYKSLGFNYSDTGYGYNWPYDYFSLLEMAEIRAELTYDTEITEDASRFNVGNLGEQIQRAIEGRTIASESTSVGRAATTEVTAPEPSLVTRTATTETTISVPVAPTRTTTTRTAPTTATTLTRTVSNAQTPALSLLGGTPAPSADTSNNVLSLLGGTAASPPQTSLLGGTGNTAASPAPTQNVVLNLLK